MLWPAPRETGFGRTSWSKRLTPIDVISVAVLVAEALNRAGVAYFLGGSLASSYQGEPRATNDIDLVVAMDRARQELDESQG